MAPFKSLNQVFADIWDNVAHALRVTITGALNVTVANPAAPTVVSGIATASAIGAVIADTGDLAVGAYLLEITMGFSGVSAAGKHLLAERRNAGDTATVHTLAMCPAGGAMGMAFARVDVAANESIRVIVGPVAAAAGEVATACIRAYKIA